MNNETAISTLASQLITTVYQDTVQAYMLIGALALLIYASFFHFPDEVEFMWKAKFTLPTYLYFFSKYPVFFYLSLSILEIFVPETTLRLCNNLGILTGVIALLPLFGTQGLILIRAYALCQGYRPVMTIGLFMPFLAALVSMVYVNALPACMVAPALDNLLVTLYRIYSITLILSDTVAFIVTIHQIWGLWKMRQSVGLQIHEDFTTLLLRQGISRFCLVLLITITVVLLISFSSTSIIGDDITYFQDVLSTLLLCEFTLDLRRRNTQNSIPNPSALDLPTISFHESPVQSIRSALGRLHESIVTEMGERNDPMNIDGPGSGDPVANGLQDIPHDTDLDRDETPDQVQGELTA